MNKFAVVTDSAADIPVDLAQKLDIRIVPLHVTFMGRDYRDGEDISTAGLLDLMRGAETLPQTSQPTPADFLEVYQQLYDEGYTQVLSIHLSRKLSSTIESARAIAGRIPEGARLEVVDSCSATVAQGAMVLEAAVMAQRGATLDEALKRVEDIRASYSILFVPDTLDNLVKGGRATKMQGLVTSLLNIKIVAGLDSAGGIEVLHKAKGAKGAVSYIAKHVAKLVQERGAQVCYLLHTDAEPRVRAIEDALLRVGAKVRVLTAATIGPVIATHVGERAFGIFCYPEALHSSELDGVSEYLTPEF